MTYLDWLQAIVAAHPVITYYPIDDWEFIARFNGYLPLPPQVAHPWATSNTYSMKDIGGIDK